MALAEACYLTGHEQAGEQILAHAVQNAPEDARVHGQARAVLRAAGKSDEHGDALIETNQRQVILLNVLNIFGQLIGITPPSRGYFHYFQFIDIAREGSLSNTKSFLYQYFQKHFLTIDVGSLQYLFYYFMPVVLSHLCINIQ